MHTKIAIIGTTSQAQIMKLQNSLLRTDLIFVDKIEDLPDDDLYAYDCYTSCGDSQLLLYPPDTLVKCGRIRKYKTKIIGNRKTRRGLFITRRMVVHDKSR